MFNFRAFYFMNHLLNKNFYYIKSPSGDNVDIWDNSFKISDLIPIMKKILCRVLTNEWFHNENETFKRKVSL